MNNKIENELQAIVDRHIGNYWNPSLEQTVRKEVEDFLLEKGLIAKDLELYCEDDGFVIIEISEYYNIKQAN